jgi:hypothetical protein
MLAPVASGWSDRRVGLAPTGKAPPCHSARGKPTFMEAKLNRYGWFTEGFDTPDLKEAKALIDELSASWIAGTGPAMTCFRRQVIRLFCAKSLVRR